MPRYKTPTIKVKVAPANATNAKVTFKSSNPKMLHVDAAGKLTAKKTGTAKITIRAGGKQLVKTVHISWTAVKTITLNKTKATLSRKGTLRLQTTLMPANADKTIIWATSNKKVATVTANGLVKATGKGSCTITARTLSGKKVTCKITVK